jgi:hypothetical protein
MILDFQNETPPNYFDYDVVDLDTGLPLDVWYADDATGEYRIYVTERSEPGGGASIIVDPATDKPMTETHFGRIKVVPVSESPRNKSRWGRVEGLAGPNVYLVRETFLMRGGRWRDGEQTFKAREVNGVEVEPGTYAKFVRSEAAGWLFQCNRVG